MCQGPAEADKWVDLLTQNLSDKRRTGTMDLKRNVSTTGIISTAVIGSVVPASLPTTTTVSHVNIYDHILVVPKNIFFQNLPLTVLRINSFG